MSTRSYRGSAGASARGEEQKPFHSCHPAKEEPSRVKYVAVSL